MAANPQHRVDREIVASFHEEQLAELVRHVQASIEGFQSGELDAFTVDEVIFQYSRAAKELWKFCNLGRPEITARIIREDAPGDWWEAGARRRRGAGGA